MRSTLLEQQLFFRQHFPRPAFLALGVSFLLVLLFTAEAQALGQDDHLLAIARQTRVIHPAELMANDWATLATTLEIEQDPTYGDITLVPDAGGSFFEYMSPLIDGNRPFHGRDQFTYRLVSDGQESAAVTVYLTVQPLWRPISGRWSAPVGGVGGAGFGNVDGPEDPRPNPPELTGGLGFYNTAEAYFKLCELVTGQFLTDCERFDVPHAYATPGLNPIIGDWDNDEEDEVGVHDPTTGKWILFDLNRTSCKEEGTICLSAVADLAIGANGDQPLIGDWGGIGSIGDQFGLYEPTSGWARLEPDFSSDDLMFMFEYLIGGAGADEIQAFAGEWNTNTPETAAIYSPATGKFSYATSDGGTTFVSFNAETLTGPLTGGVAFPITDLSGDSRFMGLFFEAEKYVYLFATTDDHNGQIPVRVPTDPDGYSSVD